MATVTVKPSKDEVKQAEAEAQARAGSPDPPEPDLSDLPPLERKEREALKKRAVEAVKDRKRILKDNGIEAPEGDVANQTIAEVKEAVKEG